MSLLKCSPTLSRVWLSLVLLIALLGGAARASALIPFFFEENRGQISADVKYPDVKYLARTPGYTVQLAEQEVVLVPAPRPTDAPTMALRLHWIGGTADPQIEALEPLRARVHYHRGNDPSAWTSHIPTFARVRYTAVYPGIDLELYGRDGQLEYDFVVAPGADPRAIGLVFDGATPQLVDDGSLRLGALMQSAPFTYQETATGRREIASHYVVDGERVGFAVGAYVADPDPSNNSVEVITELP